MAGTVEITYVEHRTMKKVTLDWLSDASGDVSGTPTKYLSGEVRRVVFIPDAAGTQPTNLYDVTLIDDNGIDILAGQGTDLSNTTTTDFCPGIMCDDSTATMPVPTVTDDTLDLVVANAGNAKGGKVVIYYR